MSVDGAWATAAGQPEVSVTTGEGFAPYVADGRTGSSSGLRGRADGHRLHAGAWPRSTNRSAKAAWSYGRMPLLT